MEKLMKDAVLYKTNPQYAYEYAAVMLAYLYWKDYDFTENDNMANIFFYLYLCPENFNNTLVKSYTDLKLSERTLIRYRKRFVNSFKAQQKKLRKLVKSDDAELLDHILKNIEENKIADDFN